MNDRVFHLFVDGPAPVAPYSHAVTVDGWIFLTGQLPTGGDDDPVAESIEEQTVTVMENLKSVLAGCGAALDHVVSLRIFLTRFEADYEIVNRIYAGYFPPDRRPARTTMGVNALARGCFIEIDLIARLPA